MNNHPEKVLALLEDMRQVVAGRAFDHLSQRWIQVGPRELDVLVLCAPCQAFSMVRDVRQQGPEQHGAFAIQMVHSVEYIRVRQPFLVLQEQVLGKFTAKTSKGMAVDSHLEGYLASIRDIRDPQSGKPVYQGVLCVTMDSKDWVQCSRRRMYMAFCKDRALLHRAAARLQASTHINRLPRFSRLLSRATGPGKRGHFRVLIKQWSRSNKGAGHHFQ